MPCQKKDRRESDVQVMGQSKNNTSGGRAMVSAIELTEKLIIHRRAGARDDRFENVMFYCLDIMLSEYYMNSNLLQRG